MSTAACIGGAQRTAYLLSFIFFLPIWIWGSFVLHWIMLWELLEILQPLVMLSVNAHWLSPLNLSSFSTWNSIPSLKRINVHVTASLYTKNSQNIEQRKSYGFSYYWVYKYTVALNLKPFLCVSLSLCAIYMSIFMSMAVLWIKEKGKWFKGRWLDETPCSVEPLLFKDAVMWLSLFPKGGKHSSGFF